MQRFVKLLKLIRYKNWTFYLGKDGDRMYLQVIFTAKCTNTNVYKPHFGRKWFISPHMTNSEFVGTAFKAVLTAEEHECRENFKYDDYAIYGPHLDILDLLEVVKKGNFDIRNPE